MKLNESVFTSVYTDYVMLYMEIWRDITKHQYNFE